MRTPNPPVHYHSLIPAVGWQAVYAVVYDVEDNAPARVVIRTYPMVGWAISPVSAPGLDDDIVGFHAYEFSYDGVLDMVVAAGQTHTGNEQFLAYLPPGATCDTAHWLTVAQDHPSIKRLLATKNARGQS